MSTSVTYSGSVTDNASMTAVPSFPFNISPSVSAPLNFTRSYNSADITKVYWNTYSVTSTPTTIDLTSLTDIVGNALSFSTLVYLKVINQDTTNHLTIGGVEANDLFGVALPFTLAGQNRSSGNGGSSGSAGSTGSEVSLVTNITVDATHKLLSLTASAGTISVQVLVAGN